MPSYPHQKKGNSATSASSGFSEVRSFRSKNDQNTTERKSSARPQSGTGAKKTPTADAVSKTRPSSQSSTSGKQAKSKITAKEFIDALSVRLGGVDNITRNHSRSTREVVLIVGNTGAGKSTFANYIIGKHMREEKVTGSLEKGIVCDDPVMEIGHGFLSKTDFPHVHCDHQTGLTFCDCPGFLDTRDALFDIANMYAMTKVSREVDSIRAIVVVLSYRSLLSDRGRALTDTSSMLETIFGTSAFSRQHLQSVIVLISKAPRDADVNVIRSFLLEGSESSSEAIRGVFSRAHLCDPLERTESAPHRDVLLGTLRACPPLARHAFTFRLAPESLEQLTMVVHAARSSLFQSEPVCVEALVGKTFQSSYICLRSLLHKLQVLGSSQILDMKRALEDSLDRNIRLLVRSSTWKPGARTFTYIEQLKEMYIFSDAVAFVERHTHQQRKEQEAQRAREARLEKERLRVQQEETAAEERRQKALKDKEVQERREAEAKRARDAAERERLKKQQELEAAQRARREAEERARERYHPGQRVLVHAMTMFGPMMMEAYSCCMQPIGSPGCRSGCQSRGPEFLFFSNIY
jgi:energy-coupling factor transporter ATP-binding protein EcfA2